ncbi:MAG: ATP-dependent DNA ligase [Candidatus Woesearchaeota archaeon]
MDYSKLVGLYEQIDSTTKRLAKTALIADFLKHTDKENIGQVILLLQGRLFPEWSTQKLGVAARLVIKAISTATGSSASAVEDEWKKTGDIGTVAFNLVKKKSQNTLFSHNLTVKKVFDNLKKLAELEGEGTVDKKVGLIAELLTSAEPKEAKYIVRTVIEDLRVGIGAGTLRDAIARAFLFSDKDYSYDEELNNFEPKDREAYNNMTAAVQTAYDRTNDFAVVAEAAVKGLHELEKLEVMPGIPVKVMLAPKESSIAEGFERVGKPGVIEFKYDGFRIQAHKFQDSGKEKIELFTRRLEPVTKQFPEVVDFVRNYVDGKSFILDCEAVGFDRKTGKYVAFQNISQRIRRKYNISEMAKTLPVELNVFDILYYNGANMISEPYEKRWQTLKKIIKEKKHELVLAQHLITADMKEAEEFYQKSLDAGNEGVMMKNKDSPYKPGARVGYMIKIKPVMETLDLGIVGAEWGTGKRAGWLTSFILACQDDDGRFLEIGRVGTGFKELEESGGATFEELTKLLKPFIIEEKGKIATIKPEIVIEIKFEEIQKSPTYSSGFALRFPRLAKIRDDRGINDIEKLSRIKKMYDEQRERSK